METQLELEHRSKIADEKLGVAEELGGVISVLSGLVVYVKWSSWLASILIGLVVYFAVVYRYRKEAERCEDEYHRAAGLGKYFRELL